MVNDTVKVFLDNLPKKYNKSKIDWKNSVGKTIKFKLNDILGELHIEQYNKGNVIIKYKDKNFKINTGHLKNGQIRNILGIKTKEYRHNIGQVLNSQKSGVLEIVECIRIKHGIKTEKGYKYKCLLCNYEGEIQEHHLKENKGCSVCSGNKILTGFNDMWTTNPNLAKLLYNKSDGYKYSQSTNKKLDWVCPNCNNIIKNKSANQILNNGLFCCKCSDGLSFGEKFVYNLLEQLNLNFNKEKIFEWSKGSSCLESNAFKNKRYDFFIPDYNTIIEIHGNHHYFRGFKGGKKRTLAEEQENDLMKYNLAIQNNISNYIIVDAKYSELEYLKNSILQSKLSKLFDLRNVNWLKCCEHANKSLLKKVCELWESGIKQTKEISQKIGINAHTVVRYLHMGTSLGLCNYSPKMSIISKPVVQLCISTGDIVNEFIGICEASRATGISKGNISKNCKHKYKHAGGYRWIYSHEYYKNKNGG